MLTDGLEPPHGTARIDLSVYACGRLDDVCRLLRRCDRAAPDDRPRHLGLSSRADAALSGSRAGCGRILHAVTLAGALRALGARGLAGIERDHCDRGGGGWHDLPGASAR